MRVTEQIDALSTLSTNPIKYLVVPRLIAGLISPPFPGGDRRYHRRLGGYVIAVYKLGFNSAVYLRNTIDFVTDLDVASGLVKAAVFGFIITLMGCYQGYNSRGGAPGGGCGNHQCRGLGLHHDPGAELLPHRGLLLAMTEVLKQPKIAVAGLHKVLRREEGPARGGSHASANRRIGRGHRRLGLGQIGAHQMHPGAAASRFRQHPGGWPGDGGPHRPRPGEDAPPLRHAVPGLGPIRFLARSGRTSPSG